ncbi:MAG: LPS-assembly protein LptD [Candidatus Omnitrophica bacterium]|nr:LPS-assembly protein LptD [Candidatus Omnitrophota bacterium]
MSPRYQLINKKLIQKILNASAVILLCYFVVTSSVAIAQESKKIEQPIVVNGDTVEYSADNKDVVALGNVKVEYKGSTLTCDKLTVNTQTKEGVAEGNVRLDDQKGIIEGSTITYNFQNKTGTIIDAGFRANPYFGRAKKVQKLSDTQFTASDGYFTSCNLDHPHFRFDAKSINMFPNDKVQTRSDTLRIGNIPILYLPWFNRSLKDNMMHVQVIPGKRKEWGYFALGSWRYNLNEYVDGRVYLDYRERLGFAQGIGANYDTRKAGKGDVKFYYTREDDQDAPVGISKDFTRHLVRWRHSWNIDPSTSLISQLYKITDNKRKYLSDANFLKTYFYREFEKDSQPLSYVSFSRRFRNSSLDVTFQKRVNQWFDQLDRLPEARFTLPSLQLGSSRLYLADITTLSHFDKRGTLELPSTNEVDMTRFDTYNKLSLPMRVMVFNFTPFVANRSTVYDKDNRDNNLPYRAIFYSGADVSTKFYRVFDVQSDFLGLNLNGLRHVVTPSVGYAFNHEPTISRDQLKQIDEIDALTRSNAVSLQLENKLQTKHAGQSVDLVDILLKTNYIIKPKYGETDGSSFSDFLVDLELTPYSWLRVDADATFKHSGGRSHPSYNRFITANYDINFNFGKDRSIGAGQRYERKGSNEVTANLTWRFNPKWKLGIYERYNLHRSLLVKSGLLEQQYTITRDLHCAEMDLSYNIDRDEGHTVWVIFRLKAFPGMELGFDQSYNKPSPGSQNNN